MAGLVTRGRRQPGPNKPLAETLDVGGPQGAQSVTTVETLRIHNTQPEAFTKRNSPSPIQKGPTTMRINVSSIGLPSPYIRKNTNNERINMWTEQVRSSAEPNIKAGMTPVDAILKSYFLPEIHVMKLAQAETFEYTGTDRKKHTKTIGYRIIDGAHRFLHTQNLGLDSIECKVYEPMSPAASYALQYKLNNDGPLPFNRETRDAAIRQMSKFKLNGKPEMTLAMIATQTGISEGQVSRILSGKSGGKTAEEVSKARSKGGKAKGKARSKGGFDSASYFKGIKEAARIASGHVKVLRDYLGEHDKVWESCQDLIDSLQELKKK
jgi:hypothetical protein